MHNVCMQARCNHMRLARIPRRDHMCLAYCMMYNDNARTSRRDPCLNHCLLYSRDRSRRKT